MMLDPRYSSIFEDICGGHLITMLVNCSTSGQFDINVLSIFESDTAASRTSELDLQS